MIRRILSLILCPYFAWHRMLREYYENEIRSVENEIDFHYSLYLAAHAGLDKPSKEELWLRKLEALRDWHAKRAGPSL